MKRIISSIAALLVAFVAAGSLAGCEDSAPTAYMPEPVLEAFLIVGEPIHDIRVTLSQSVTDTFRYSNSAVPNADVKLIAGDRTLQLAYRANAGAGEYYYPDTTVLVEPTTHYKVVATMPGGAVVSGETTTPVQISWIDAPKTPLQYPIDTLNLPRPPDSIALSWTPAPSVSEYIISVRSLDTLEYGIYLDPPTAEKNRRIGRFWEENAPFYDDVARIAFLQESNTPVSWFAFKWFGRQEVAVYASDVAFVNWYKMTHFQNPPSYQPLLGNVTGGLGVVASASVARKEIFLLKNQP
jgi:hypothetical protein